MNRAISSKLNDQRTANQMAEILDMLPQAKIHLNKQQL